MKFKGTVTGFANVLNDPSDKSTSSFMFLPVGTELFQEYKK